MPRATEIVLHQASHTLEVAFDDGARFNLPWEYLRVESPSAEVQGHGPGQRVLVPGKRDVKIVAATATDDYKFTRLIIEIAKSDPFRNRRGKDPTP